MSSDIALRSARCAVCWAPADNNHHEPPLSQESKHDDTITLCGFGNSSGCHGLAHHNGGNLNLHKPSEPGPWHFTADERAVAAINARRKSTMLTPIRVGKRYRVIAIEETEGLDELRETQDATAAILATATSTFRALDSDLATTWRKRAVIIARVYDSVDAATANEWVTTDCGMSKALASRSRTVVRHLGETLGMHLNSEAQYYAAVAVKKGVGTPEQMVAEVEALGLGTFLEEKGLVKKRAKDEPEYVCPHCGDTFALSECDKARRDA